MVLCGRRRALKCLSALLWAFNRQQGWILQMGDVGACPASDGMQIMALIASRAGSYNL